MELTPFLRNVAELEEVSSRFYDQFVEQLGEAFKESAHTHAHRVMDDLFRSGLEDGVKLAVGLNNG